MKNLDKEFDKWFEDTWVAGSTGYIDIHRDEINDMKKDINNFIRQREKDLLEELEVKLIAEEAKGSLGVPAPRVLDTFMRKELSNE